jgi:23S rRNA pseudouridine1911/1915/1917 synthase
MAGAQAPHLDRNGNPRIIERHFVVREEFAGLRLDVFLQRQIPRLSRTRLQTLIRTQLTHSDGRRLKAHTRVMAGEHYILRRAAQAEPECPRDVAILYEDNHLMVVDKPAGLPVHASAKFYFNTLMRVLSERFPEQGLQIAHRLDRETSGCLVVARGREPAARLKRSFAGKLVAKTYLAIVIGTPPWAGGHLIDLPLRLVDPVTHRISVRMEPHRDGLPSATRVEVLEVYGDRALVRCTPITGRQHQIRVHLAAAGYPIVGDKLYAHGDEAFAEYCANGLTDELQDRFELPRQALHAARIAFPHPETGAVVAVDSPLPADLVSYVQARRAPAAAPLRSA